MFCPTCGAQMEDGALFCTGCGAKLEQESEVIAEEAAEEAAEEVAAPAEEVSEQEAPVEAPTIQFADDFDPRVFAGLDAVPAPPVFPDMEEEASEEYIPEFEQPKEKKSRKQKKEKQPKEKKGGKGGVIAAIVLIVVLLLAAGAAGFLYWFSTPLSPAELEKSFVTNGPLDAAETSSEAFAFEVLSEPGRVTERLELSDRVWCKVTTQDSEVKRVRSYALTYELTWDGWILTKDGIVEFEPEQWVTEPLVGASDEVIRQALVGQTVAIDEYEYALTAEDLIHAEIITNPDLKAGTDAAQVTVSATTDLITWEADLELEMVFGEDGWELKSCESDPVRWEAVPGKEFEPTDDEIMAEFEDMVIAAVKEPVEETPETEEEAEEETEAEVEVEAEEETVEAAPEITTDQTVTIKKDEITNLVVKEPEINLEDETYVVRCEFDLRKPAAVIEVKAELVYTFSDGWTVQSKDYSSSIKEIVLDGEWNGTYEVDAGGLILKPSVTLTVSTDESKAITGEFAFGPSAEFSQIIPGSYHVKGSIDLATMTVKFEAGEWIKNPNTGIKTVSLEGKLNLDTGVITDDDTFTITMKVPEKPAEPEKAPETEAPAADAPATDAAATETPTTQTPETQAPATEQESGSTEVLPELGDNDLPWG